MTTEERLGAVERRLAALEARLAVGPPSSPAPSRPEVPPVVAAGGASPAGAGNPPITAASEPDGPSRLPGSPPTRGPSAALVLGWTGAGALVLAAAYLVRLGIEDGWLTPARQLAGAALLGVAMLAEAVALRAKDRPYSSLLGAGGVSVLYLTIFAAHVVHHLIGAPAAAGLVAGIAALSLLLHALFREPLYVAFALLGSYACPLLVPNARGGPLDLAVYLTVWNAVYCAYALWIGRRVVYVAALYAGLLIFDWLWRGPVGGTGWDVAAAFQLVQFILFLTAVALFSIRSGRPLSPSEAWAHFPALLLFYGVEYAILDEHAARWAPVAAVAFAAFLYAVYAAARRTLRGERLPSLALVNAFGALVLVHAIYLDAMQPVAWRPLLALVLSIAIPRLARWRSGFDAASAPYRVAAVFLFAAGWLEILAEWGGGDDPLDVPLAVLYPGAVYATYLRLAPASGAQRPLLLAVAHLQLLVACALLVDRIVPGSAGRLWLSLAWAVAGTLVLIAARVRDDRLLARSSLWIYALFAGKVLVLDLSDAAPLVRVGCLAVLGVSLYAGGWIYRRVLPPSPAEAGGRIPAG